VARRTAAAYADICAFSTMLDSLVDLDADTRSGNISYIGLYPSQSAAVDGLRRLAVRSRAGVADLPSARVHNAIVVGLAGFYLSHDGARSNPATSAAARGRRAARASRPSRDRAPARPARDRRCERAGGAGPAQDRQRCRYGPQPGRRCRGRDACTATRGEPAMSTPIRRRTCTAVAGVVLAALAATVSPAAARTVDVVEHASLTLDRRDGTRLYESGRATGTLPGKVAAVFTVSPWSVTGTVTLLPNGGGTLTFSVNGKPSRRARGRTTFTGTMKVLTGTGRYAGARGKANFTGTVVMRTWAATVTARGRLTY